MPNLFRIDFVQGKTDAADYGQVKHSLVDTDRDREIISLIVSADKLHSVSNYSREPKRLVFECFPGIWIEENILSGNNEHERYISHFEVKVYRDNVLIFTGIIDTSQLSFDVSSGILKMTCYDKIKLLSVFSDLTHQYSRAAGYLPIWILGYFLQDIEQTIPISIPYTNQLGLASLDIPMGSALTVAHIDFDDMILFPPQLTWGWTYSYHDSGWPGPYYGYRVNTAINEISFVFAYKKVIQSIYNIPGVYQSHYQARFRGRVIRFYNSICAVVSEYEEKSNWETDLASLGNADNEFMDFFAEKGISSSNLFTGLSSTGSLEGKVYGSSQYYGHWVEASFHGNLLPVKVHPGKAYETYQAEQTESLKALQAMLMMYNATIFTDAIGRIVLKNKDAYSSEILSIDDRDVISLISKRGNQEVPDVGTIDVLAGDTTQLQGMIKSSLLDFYDSKWSIEARISQLSKYDIGLYAKIQIQSRIYAIIEVDRDIAHDEIKLKAWRL